MLKIGIFAAIVAIAAASQYLDVNRDVFLIYRNQKQFALNMLDALCAKNPTENVFFSPHITYRALLSAYFAAEGETEQSLKKGLQLDWAATKTEVFAAYKMELEAVQFRTYGENIEYYAVDKTFITKDAYLKPQIVDVLTDRQIARYNFARPEQARSIINAQVEDVTHQQIKGLLPPGSITADSKLLLANAAFFKGKWSTRFDKDKTANETFFGATEKIVEMMQTKATVLFGDLPDEAATFCELRYEDQDNGLSMVVFLPTTGTVDELVKRLTPKTFKNTEDYGNYVDVNIKLPKMSFNKEMFLAPILEEKMGIKNLFGSGSNLSGFADNIAVTLDNVTQKAVFSADEEGVDAPIETDPDSTDDFNANRPYVFAITDYVSKEVLFAGVYRGPGN